MDRSSIRASRRELLEHWHLQVLVTNEIRARARRRISSHCGSPCRTPCRANCRSATNLNNSTSVACTAKPDRHFPGRNFGVMLGILCSASCWYSLCWDAIRFYAASLFSRSSASIQSSSHPPLANHPNVSPTAFPKDSVSSLDDFELTWKSG